MLQRCNNKKTKSYKDYGERGIKVCDEWSKKDGFMEFYNWSIGNGYSENLTIDRVDNDMGYSPNNCRWITKGEQQLNKRNSITIEYKGMKKTIKEWAKIYDLNVNALYRRYVYIGLMGSDLFLPSRNKTNKSCP
jgi:hypothetical protein